MLSKAEGSLWSVSLPLFSRRWTCTQRSQLTSKQGVCVDTTQELHGTALYRYSNICAPSNQLFTFKWPGNMAAPLGRKPPLQEDWHQTGRKTGKVRRWSSCYHRYMANANSALVWNDYWLKLLSRHCGIFFKMGFEVHYLFFCLNVCQNWADSNNLTWKWSYFWSDESELSFPLFTILFGSCPTPPDPPVYLRRHNLGQGQRGGVMRVKQTLLGICNNQV